VAAPLAVEVGATLPHGAGEQDTVQVTPRLLRSLPTVAVSCAEVVSMTVALEGWVVTVMAGTTMVAEPIASESATEVAVIVTCKSLGGGAGAV